MLLILLTNVTDSQLYAIANRFRKAVEQSSFFTGESVIRATISLGATIAKPGENINDLIKRADALLYKSKNSGRNKVSVELKV